MIFSGGTRRPSWKISVASPANAPGTMPPISAMCPIATAKPSSSPSTNTGLKNVCSGVCSPPRYGSLCTITSPCSIVCSGISCTQVLISSGMPPICAGQNSAHAIMSPCVSASAQVKSSASLKIVEYDVFISVMPISRQIDTIVEFDDVHRHDVRRGRAGRGLRAHPAALTSRLP